jgi:uncharacterized membrane protein YkoI
MSLLVLILFTISLFVYGEKSQAYAMSDADRSMAVEDDDKPSKSKKKKDEASSKSKKDDDDDDDSAKRKQDTKKVTRISQTRALAVETKSAPKAAENGDAEPAEKAASSRPAEALSSEAKYISLEEALKQAKAAGATGDILQVDMEWDPVVSAASWDVTFSSGTEYEIHAITGKLIGTKPKGLAKLANMLPLDFNGDAKNLLTFKDIMKKAETEHGHAVVEMELKRLKGRAETIYEVVLANGSTIFLDAATGKPTAGA